jgi:hypothetical protein
MSKLFPTVWYKFFKQFFPRKREEVNKVVMLDDYGFRMYWQIRIALLFGLEGVIFGDSNAEELQDFESMKRLVKLCVNIGIGGTTADEWADFFKKGYWGKKIYSLISKKIMIANIGGNNVLQNRMPGLSGIDELDNIFEDIYWINIPKVWYTLFPRDIRKDLKMANNKIKSVAKPGKLIDIELVTDSGSSDLPYFFIHKDMVHFSNEFDYKVRIPLINATVFKAL